MYTYLCYDLCGVLSMATLVLALILRRLTKGRNNQLFLAICVSILLTGVLDILTEYLDHMAGISDYYTMLRFLLDSLFFLVHNSTLPLYLLYVCSAMGLWYKIERRLELFHLCTVPFCIDLLIIFSNPWNKLLFYFDSDLNYQRGPLFIFLYVIAFIYIIVSIVMIVKYRYLLTKARYLALITFVPINALSAFVQMLFPEYRIEIFASVIVSIVVAVTVHRPEETIDSIVGVQSYAAFIYETRTNFAAKSPVTYLFIKFDNYLTLRKNLGIDNYLLLLRIFTEKTESICKAMHFSYEYFYLGQGRFAIVTSDNKYDALLDAGRTLLAYMQEPVKLRHLEVRVNPRVCIVRCPEDIDNEESLLNFVATFQNKLPNEKRVLSLEQVAKSKDFRIKNDMDEIIKRGIEEKNFQMYYQPIYSAKENRFVSAEALIRLKDSTYGFVSPALFIPVAEESGAIHDIGDFVIDDVCRFIGSREFEKLGLEYIEINLSVAQLIETGLVDKICSAMKKYGVRPEQINLEITETAADYDPQVSDVNIEKLREAGLTFSLDDYGTGYSNISRVVSLPLDIVKLDKSLVDDMDTPLMWIVIKNTVSMLKKMNKKILVEGIEDKRSLDRFVEIGCDYIQGYYFSKPLPETEYIEFITTNNK